MKSFFQKEINGLKLWWLFIPLSLGIIFLLVGTFRDLEISQAIVNQKGFLGILFEGWGLLIPFAIAALGSSAVAGGLYQRERKLMRVLAIAILVIGVLVLGFLTGHYIADYYSGGEWLQKLGFKGKLLAYSIGALLMAAASIPCFFLFKKKDPETALRTGLFILAWIVFEAALLEIAKRACYRPRFRYIAGYVYDDEGNIHYASPEQIELFRPWYRGWLWFRKPNTPISGDIVKSFPSGHTGMGSIVLAIPTLLPLFGLSEAKLKLWQLLSFAFALAYFLLLAFSRVYAGAHFVSDVSMSTILISGLGIALIVISNAIKSQQKANKQNEI